MKPKNIPRYGSRAPALRSAATTADCFQASAYLSAVLLGNASGIGAEVDYTRPKTAVRWAA